MNLNVSGPFRSVKEVLNFVFSIKMYKHIQKNIFFCLIFSVHEIIGFIGTFSYMYINALCLYLPSHYPPCLPFLLLLVHSPPQVYFLFLYNWYNVSKLYGIKCNTFSIPLTLLYSWPPLFSLHIYCPPSTSSKTMFPCVVSIHLYSHLSSLIV